MVKHRTRRTSDHATGGHGGASHERWLLTYADMITLLLIFFVVMYAMSNVDAKKFAAIADVLTRALGGGAGLVLDYPGPSIVPGQSTEHQSSPLLRELQPTKQTPQTAEAERMEQLATRLRAYLERQGLLGQVTVTLEERGIVVSFPEVVLFSIGSADLTPQAHSILVGVAEVLRDIPNYIRVEGHTCDLPIRNHRFPSNWELSVARATNVVQALTKDAAIQAARLAATGYAEFRPRVPNTNESNRQRNRRVDLVILRSKYEAVEPAPH